MESKELKIINKMGIHARPASAIVQVTSKFPCDITFIKDGIHANAKSIMNILLLAAEPGTFIKVVTEGKMEKEAMEAISNLFTNKFNQ